jgi:polyvinyl alcohol dehydrogenase (cytochrome)
MRMLRVAAPTIAAVLLSTTLSSAGWAGTSGGTPATSDWTSIGQNIDNTRNAATEHVLGPWNVGRLTPRWVLTTGGDVLATPTVARGVVYAPDLGGNLWAVDALSGRVLWSRKIADYTGIAGDVSRDSPAIYGDELVIGDGVAGAPASTPGGAYLVGIDARTGALRWRTHTDADPYALMTGSPIVDDGVVYAGVSSREEEVPGLTPTFRGSVIALDAATGGILWKTYMVPSGYTGGAVWGSPPVIDHETGLVYVGTGNNYSVPAGICEYPAETGCTPTPADDHQDAVVALDIRTGAVAWSHATLIGDAWNQANPAGPDDDFGSAPNLYTTVVDGRPTQLLGIGQKTGYYWALDPWTGDVVWKTAVGPGGAGGGIMWGSATDGRRIYVAISNAYHIPYTITSVTGQTSTINGGSWAALDPATGRIIWQTADPQGALDVGFVSTANGVVYAGSDATSGNTAYAVAAATGTVLWAYPTGGGVISGAAIVDGSVYWGSGNYFPAGAGNDKLYAFSLPFSRWTAGGR